MAQDKSKEKGVESWARLLCEIAHLTGSSARSVADSLGDCEMRNAILKRLTESERCHKHVVRAKKNRRGAKR